VARGRGETSPNRLARQRAASQLLHRPGGAAHPADVASAICGAQAQEPRAGRLSLRCRNAHLTGADIDRARTEERSLLRTWAMRKTMHLLATDDASWMLPLFEPAMATWSQRRLAHFGMDARTQDRTLEAIERALAADGPLPREELTEHLERERIKLDQPRRTHIYSLAVTRGVACLGPDIGARAALVLRRDWLDAPKPHDRDAALRDLTRRYLRAFAPATEVDFAGWSGLGLGDVRSGLAGIASEIVEVSLGGETAYRLKGPARRPGRGVVRLLPAYDTYLMGHRNRDFIAANERWRQIMPGGGILRPAIVVDGVAVGTWRQKRSGKAIRVELEPFERLDATMMRAIEAEVADIGRFEGVPAVLAGSG